MRKRKDAPQIEPRITDVDGGCKRANVGKDRFYELLNSGEIGAIWMVDPARSCSQASTRT